MLLALWFDFWTLSDWVPSPPTPPAQTRGQLGGRGKKRHERYDYDRADDEWWEEYEKMLTRLHKIEVREDSPVEVVAKAKEANRLIEAIQTKVPPSKEAFQKVAAKIVELSSQIVEFELQSRDEEDALLVLLL